jgi:hypothetical protein
MTLKYNYRLKTSSSIVAICLQSLCIVALLASPALGFAESASGESDSPAISIDDIALELSSPAPRLFSIDWDLEYTTYQGDLPGADDQTAYSNILTTSWPIKLKSGKNFLLRATIPIHGDQPGWKPKWYLDYADFVIRQLPTLDGNVGGFGSGHDHLGAVGFDISYGSTNENGLITSLGIANILPTSEDMSARRGQWLIGPEFALGQVTSWGLIGMRVKHLTNIDGEGEQELGKLDTNETTLKLFFAYALGNGWSIESNPVILYDWEAVSGNEWSVPVGAGVSKTLMFGRVPTKLAFEIQNFVASPDRFGPEWLFRFSLTPVISSKVLR